jgi:hypothetical protein
MTAVLDYRPPLADRPLTRLAMWLASPMSLRWRTTVVVSSCLVLWGAAWLPGATVVEVAGWAGLAICAIYGVLRRQLRWCVRTTHGLPSIGTPHSERYGWKRLLLVTLATSSPFFWWPLRVSLLVQRPLLDRFAWHTYAESPMLEPPATPRLVGLFIVARAGAAPNCVRIQVFGANEWLEYSPDLDVGPTFRSSRIPWFLGWTLPPSGQRWSVDSMRYKSYCG